MASNAKEYGEKIRNTISGGFQSMLLAAGFKLKLFDFLGDDKEPRTSEEIAKLANLKERYVREWLHGVVIGGFVECDPTGQKFWLSSAAIEVLKNGHASVFMASATVIPVLSLVFDQICQCFKIDGPSGVPYSACGPIHDTISACTDPAHEATLVPFLIPTIPSLLEELERGITCLDIGCGTGTVTILLASRFPKSQFYGVDIFASVIDSATKRAKDKSLANAHFVVGDARTLPVDWASKFSYVTAFDAVHDLARPDLALSEIIRVLKPGGRFTMLDINANSNVYKNIGDPKANLTYTCSLFHCVPVSLHFSDGLGLGSMWGVEKATAILKEAGFASVDLVDMPWDKEKFNAHYLCTKAAVSNL